MHFVSLKGTMTLGVGDATTGLQLLHSTAARDPVLDASDVGKVLRHRAVLNKFCEKQVKILQMIAEGQEGISDQCKVCDKIQDKKCAARSSSNLYCCLLRDFSASFQHCV
jgi:hypothetical protein